MEYFQNAKTVRLKGPHGKYLWADDDGYKVVQNKEGRNIAAHWRVERVPDSNRLRFKSCSQDAYLTATGDKALMGVIGKTVAVTKVLLEESSMEWEPVKDGQHAFRLKTSHGTFLRANRGVPALRHSVTHDLPEKLKHQAYLQWQVEIVFGINSGRDSLMGPILRNPDSVKIPEDQSDSIKKTKSHSMTNSESDSIKRSESNSIKRSESESTRSSESNSIRSSDSVRF